MKVIAYYDEKMNSHVAQYVGYVENLGKYYKLLSVEEKYLPWLRTMTHHIEPNFIINLCEEQEYLDAKLLEKENILFAFIGSGQLSDRIDGYYNMQSHQLSFDARKADNYSFKQISCYSDKKEIEAADYIKCIDNLNKLSKAMNKPIVIFANIYVPNQTFRYRSAVNKIVNECLEKMNGLLILKAYKNEIYKYYTVSKKAFEFYEEKTFCFDGTVNEALRKILPLIGSHNDHFNNKKDYHCQRQNESLYNSVFYRSIGSNEPIYVLLNPGNFREPGYYQSLGLKVVPIFGSYSMLYGIKSRFDELSEQLRNQVAPLYQMPIVSYRDCIKNNPDSNIPYSVITENLQYGGKGVYIGVVTVDPVDYRNEVLRNVDGSTRIAYIWKQRESNDGQIFFREQINQALLSTDGSEILPVPDSDSSSTMMLSIAGGASQNAAYQGIATEAEFIAAQINTASEELQRIFGGVPDKNGALLHDVLIGALKLIDFATQQGRPLALCIPFNGNIDPHDGSFVLNQMIGLLAQSPNVTIITASGEEADKMHHFSVRGIQQPLNIVNMRVDKESQNIVGIIYQRFADIQRAVLYPPQAGTAAEPFNLKIQGITRLTEQTTVYCDGTKVDFNNGSEQIMFRLDNPAVGGWRIELTLETSELSQLDVWIAQQELNGYTTLRPSNPFVTVGSVAATLPLMSVGGYDRESMVVLKSSGRGFSWIGRVQPLFITHANNIIAPCRQGSWASVTGTLPAASIMLGVVAALYSKYLEEGMFPLPNTSIMNGIILEAADQFEGIVYPNESQGYGIFDTRKLSRLLAAPLIV